MLKRLQLHSLKKHIDKNLEQRDVSQRNTKLTHLGFLVHESFFEDLEQLYSLGIELGLQRKDIKVFTFTDNRRKIPSLQQNQITNKEFNWKGQILNQNAEEFLNFPFDALIGIYKDNHDFLNFMVSKSSAKFKIGFKGVDERLYDLLLDIDPKNNQLFKTEIKKYLKIFNKI